MSYVNWKKTYKWFTSISFSNINSDEKKSFFQKDWFSGWFTSKSKQNEEKEDPYPRIIKNDLFDEKSKTTTNEEEPSQEESQETEDVAIDEPETQNIADKIIAEVFI